MSFDKQYVLSILNYWHQTEFFNCVDLKDLGNSKDGVIHYSADLIDRDPNCLPWLNRENVRRAGKSYHPNRQYSYTLYLGVFKKADFFSHARTHFDEVESGDWCERKMDHGLTCTAKIPVSKDGVVALDSIELSTAPWALGQVLKGNIDNILIEDFEADSDSLIHQLQSLDKLAKNVKQSIGISDAFTTFEIIEVLKLLGDWAGFLPSDVNTKLIIKLNTINHDTSKAKSLLISSDAVMKLQKLREMVLENDSRDDEGSLSSNGGEVGVDQDEENIPILNSFFLRDLERARDLIKNDRLDHLSPLIQYLSHNRIRKPDLLSAQGEALIRKGVALASTPLGRWPSDSRHTMSLMQQFAINTIDHELREQGLYSVNGPPGTGKTTMIRDLVATNVVNRARILSKLNDSKSAFGDDIDIKIGDTVHWGVKQLIPELTGFEMVVVSNNNTAVENITKELPQKKALGEEFGEIEYLKPVAQKLAAKHDKSNVLHSLEESEDCWGLVAAALGNSKNRNRFNDYTQFKKADSMGTIGEASLSYSTLVPHIKSIIDNCGDPEDYFCSKQEAFIRQEKVVRENIFELNLLESISKARKEKRVLEESVSQIKLKVVNIRYCISKLAHKNISIFSLKKWCRNKALKFAFHKRLSHQSLALERLELKLKTLTEKILNVSEKNRHLFEKHDDVLFDADCEDIEDKKVQRITFGQSRSLNSARSQLTIKAFELHEAWLAACYTKCFTKNINIFNKLIVGNIKDYAHAKAVWQTFFMVVPVVSSAFASVASQFYQLRSGDIGWLFIDEAGQATPQQAVGALLRSQRAVVVGDPLQVEPVFTTPPEFVEYFGRKLLGSGWLKWSPTVASVQTISDRSNPYGTKLISSEFWLGSPLRVHRRCKDPMFSIANTIAYNNKMLHGSDDIRVQSPFIWGDSCWFDISGNVQGKHYVPEQGELVLEMIYAYLDESNKLPDCYVISPFKDVKYRLKQFLLRVFDYSRIERATLKDWLDERVGTVHTFQGKEEVNVIVVLGASLEASGAANWAASKPNLLNVAVTRAKSRVYVIGSKQVWGTLNYFSVASSQLPSRAKSHDFQVA